MATVYRTTSESNVLSYYPSTSSSSPLGGGISSSISVPSTPITSSSSSHLPPQDYVVVTGQKYKLRKKLNDENCQQSCSIGAGGGSGDHTRLVMLTRALEEANKTIELQSLEIKKQNEYILQLEQKLSQSISLSEDLLSSPRPRGGSHPTPMIAPIQPLSTNRKKNRLQEAIQSTKIINCDNLDQLFDGPTTPPIATESVLSNKGVQRIQATFPSPSLYIAHDNPQLGKIVFDSFGGTSATMSVMIETKDSEGLLRIILGEIMYSGLSEPITSTLVHQVDNRGGQCLVCNNMTGYIFQLSSVERRVLTKTTDIHLSPTSIINSVKFSNEIQLREFFNHCTARVDIILAPFHEGEWYPYWENSENIDPGNNISNSGGIRKLAPQFRSSGIGYLRLGDDMSSYGTSFLSADSMLTYFDNQESSKIIEDSTAPVSENIHELLKSIIEKLSQCTKWNDKCQYLKSITDLLRISLTSGLELIETQFISLTTILAKEITQSNLQVLKEALNCLCEFMNCWIHYSPWGDLIRSQTTLQLKTLLISLIQLLRHSNRSIVTSSMELLRKWFEIDASDSPELLNLNHGSCFFLLTSLHLQEVIKLKPTGIDLLLHWLSDIITLLAQRWGQFLTSHKFVMILNSPQQHEELITRINLILVPLFRHKDEKTRDATILSFGCLCGLDRLWYHGLTAMASWDLRNVPKSLSELMDQLPSSTAQYLRELSTDSSWKRLEGKFLNAIDNFMRKL